MDERRPHLRLWDDIWAQAVVTNGTRHGQHTHHPVAVPVQHLPSGFLNTFLQGEMRKSQLSSL